MSAGRSVPRVEVSITRRYAARSNARSKRLANAARTMPVRIAARSSMTAVLRPVAFACLASGLWWLRVAGVVHGFSNRSSKLGAGAAGSSPPPAGFVAPSGGFAPSASGVSAGASAGASAAFFFAVFFGFAGTSSGSTRPVITSARGPLRVTMQPAMRMSSGRYLMRAAMRASSFSCLALSSWLRAYALPCSAGSIGGLSAMSCISSASLSRRFRSVSVAAPGSPRSRCSVWIRSQSGSIWISTHFHRFARRSAVFFSSASASFTSRPRSSRYTDSSSYWLNRSCCTRPPAFS